MGVIDRRALLALSLSAPLLVACSEPTFSFKYRLKVIVRVGDQLREGASVISVASRPDANAVCLAPCFQGDVRGEAPGIDLEDRGYLFALLGRLRTENGADLAPSLRNGTDFFVGNLPIEAIGRSFPGEYSAWQREFSADAYVALFNRVRTVREEVELLATEWPTFVRFADPGLPETVQFVAPDAFGRAFGADVAFVRCTVQLTDEAVTSTINEALPWLRDLGGAQLDGRFARREPPTSTANAINSEYLVRSN